MRAREIQVINKKIRKNKRVNKGVPNLLTKMTLTFKQIPSYLNYSLLFFCIHDHFNNNGEISILE